jgi:hypothetical protein
MRFSGPEYRAQNLKQIRTATFQSRFSRLRHPSEHCADPCSDFGKSRCQRLRNLCFRFCAQCSNASPQVGARQALCQQSGNRGLPRSIGHSQTPLASTTSLIAPSSLRHQSPRQRPRPPGQEIGIARHDLVAGAARIQSCQRQRCCRAG